jgi:hypothetical protein
MLPSPRLLPPVQKPQSLRLRSEEEEAVTQLSKLFLLVAWNALYAVTFSPDAPIARSIKRCTTPIGKEIIAARSAPNPLEEAQISGDTLIL